MERYYQRRVDCRRNASGCGQNFNSGPAPRMEASCGCQTGGQNPSAGCKNSSCECQKPSCECPKPSCGNRPGMNPRPSCPCQPVNRAGFNVCRPGDCPPSANADVAMGFVPWQQWECTYPLNKGLFIGTVFPSLDKPFTIGRCAVRP